MHFEKSLRRSIYKPWKDQYIDYQKLKSLLRDNGSDAGSVTAQDDEDEWTDQDEGAFVEELVNVQLEKVHAFQSETVQRLRDRTSACEAKLDSLVASQNQSNEEVRSSKAEQEVDDKGKELLREVIHELDSITRDMSELEKFSRINYTGFLKATKKHDRKRGHAYRVRPLMQVRLAALPFNKEDYSPLLFRISTMYGFTRQNLDPRSNAVSFSESIGGNDEFTSYKFWVHPDNLLELKTVILRRLPVLIYNPQTSKIAEGGQKDPTITSIYFDNPKFFLYDAKVTHKSTASSLRLRWYDDISEAPEIYFEKKTVFQNENYENDTSQELKLAIKPKYVQSFLRGEYKMEKDIRRLRDLFGEDSEQAMRLQNTADDIQEFVKSNELQPVLRANYTRTAFQIPGDNRVRITIDTNLALIREDALDQDRPCRDPAHWHRRDVDDGKMVYPFEKIRKGEINRFPHAILEVRTEGHRRPEWVTELMNSHLVKTTPRFSKFIHGVAVLFDDYANTLPFWLSDVESDIRKDPYQAFEEELEKNAKAAEDEFAVGSLLQGSFPNPAFTRTMNASAGSPVSLSMFLDRTPEKATADMTRMSPTMVPKSDQEAVLDDVDSNDSEPRANDARRFRAFLPSISMSKYAQARRQGRVKLPPGIKKPSFWIKDEGPVKVEAKVWLANQRTYIKWQHVSILLSALSLGLFNAAGQNNHVARSLSIVYVVLSIFTSLWGYGIYIYRCNLIQKRSGKDFDHVLGPAVVCIGLIIALCLNFGLKYYAATDAKSSAPLEIYSDASTTLITNGDDL